MAEEGGDLKKNKSSQHKKLGINTNYPVQKTFSIKKSDFNIFTAKFKEAILKFSPTPDLPTPYIWSVWTWTQTSP